MSKPFVVHIYRYTNNVDRHGERTTERLCGDKGNDGTAKCVDGMHPGRHKQENEVDCKECEELRPVYLLLE